MFIARKQKLGPNTEHTSKILIKQYFNIASTGKDHGIVVLESACQVKIHGDGIVGKIT